MGQVIPDSAGVELLRAGIELNIERMIIMNADVLQDTPETRVCLRAYIGLMTIAVREWLAGRATRAQAERLLITALIATVRESLPAVQAV
jgi:hypothetical protein